MNFPTALPALGGLYRHPGRAQERYSDWTDGSYDWAGNRPYYHLQQAIFQVAEFLVIANLSYRRKTERLRDGFWLAPKKMHKLVSWGASFKMLLGQGRADYLVTVRHPLPTCISVYEKCGGLPAGGLRRVAGTERSGGGRGRRHLVASRGCASWS